MTGEGKVLSADGAFALVEIAKSSACGHDCASCGACSNPSYTITVLNPISAEPGDIVSIETPTAAVLRHCFILYILPVLIMLGAALLCEVFSLGVYGILAYTLPLAVWFALIRHRNKSHKAADVISGVVKKRID